MASGDLTDEFSTFKKSIPTKVGIHTELYLLDPRFHGMLMNVRIFNYLDSYRVYRHSVARLRGWI